MFRSYCLSLFHKLIFHTNSRLLDIHIHIEAMHGCSHRKQKQYTIYPELHDNPTILLLENISNVQYIQNCMIIPQFSIRKQMTITFSKVLLLKVLYASFVKVFPHQTFVLYDMCLYINNFQACIFNWTAY